MSLIKFISLAALICAGQAGAATMFKCVDAQGGITFTQANCPDKHRLDDVVSAYNAAPSGSSSPTQMATPHRQRQTQVPAAAQQYYPASTPRSGVTVVGGSIERAPCSTGLSGSDLRTAKVRGELVPGMSRKDVESMYGKPNSDGHARGAGASTYFRDKYVQVTHVRYGQDGCAGSSYQSGHRP